MLFLLFNSILISGTHFLQLPSTNIPVLLFSLALSFTNEHSLLALASVVYTSVATLLGLTWLQWFSPQTGPSTVSLLRLKVKQIR